MLKFQAYIAFGLGVVVRLVKAIGLLDDLLTHTVGAVIIIATLMKNHAWEFQLRRRQQKIAVRKQDVPFLRLRRFVRGKRLCDIALLFSFFASNAMYCSIRMALIIRQNLCSAKNILYITY